MEELIKKVLIEIAEIPGIQRINIDGMFCNENTSSVLITIRHKEIENNKLITKIAESLNGEYETLGPNVSRIRIDGIPMETNQC